MRHVLQTGRFDNWYPDEPNGDTEENCLMIWGNGQSYFTYMTWNDAPCDYIYYTFVCEKPIQKTSIEKLWIGLNDLVTIFRTQNLEISCWQEEQSVQFKLEGLSVIRGRKNQNQIGFIPKY